MENGGLSRRKFLQGTGAAAGVAAGLSMQSEPASAQAGRPVRVALCGIFEEVNTYATETMGYAKITGDLATGFQKFEGQEILDEMRGTSTQLGGYIAALEEADAEIVPAVYYSFSAGPTVDAAAYRQMKSEVVESLKVQGPLDGVLLAVHGAGVVADGIDDLEGDLLAAVREALGPDVKVGGGLDHHATLSPETAAQFDFLTFVMHYPHIDFYDTGFDVGSRLVQIIRGNLDTFGHWEPIPFLLQTVSTDPGNAFAPIRRELEEFGKRDGIHAMSLQYGFPWSDVPFNSVAVNCWAKEKALATATAKEFAKWMWSNRERFVVPANSARDALEAAADDLVSQGRIAREVIEDAKQLSSHKLYDQSIALLANAGGDDPRRYGFVPDDGRKGPVVIADKSDNPGAGAPGDGTHVLAELIKYGVKQACVSAIRDAEVAKQAVAAGVGATIDVELGGKLSDLGGEPVRGKAYVKTVSDGRFTVIGPMLTGLRLDLGPAAGIQIGGIDVAVISGQMQSFDNGQMRVCGFDPMDYRIVVLKSANHFRAYWNDVASFIVDADPPGIATNDLTQINYTKGGDKLYPLNRNATYLG